MVYVIGKNGQPLMPTERYGKVRRMLKSGDATVIKRCPFTIKLTYDSTTHTQSVSLGVDAGSKTIGISATTKDKALYESEVTLRNDIVDLLSARSEIRRTRRNRKTRHRKARFNNRATSRRKGWIAPSIQQKIGTHITVVNKVCSILPVTKIIVETASFDIQEIKNPDISGTDYQQGDQLGFWNVREYVLFRDGHTCQCCKGKSKDKILNVHHIESRKTGGDAPNNLITLCETCHKGYHKGTVQLPKTIKRGMSFRDATFMGIMRWAFYNKLKEMYKPSGIEVRMTFGYITKNTRIENGLPKEHYIDARCISGNPLAISNGDVYYQRKIRCHNRQLHRCTILKGGYRKNNQAPKYVRGFALFDVVKTQNKIWHIVGRRIKGQFKLKCINGDVIQITPAKIVFIGHQNGFITEKANKTA